MVVVGANRPVTAQPAPLAPGGGPPVSARNDLPPNILGAPVIGAPVRTEDRDPPFQNPHATPVRQEEVRNNPPTSTGKAAGGIVSSNDGFVRRAAALGAPETAGTPLPAQAVEAIPRSGNATSGGETVNDFLTKRAGRPNNDRRSTDSNSQEMRTSDKFGDKLGGMFGNCNDWFKSDHVFDGFISPVTNPFLFEDPRSLTEVRPIFMYQNIPGRNPDFQGGNIWFFGTQARVAFTDRLSFTFNKLGGISISPSRDRSSTRRPASRNSGLDRSTRSFAARKRGSLLAGGLQFQIPTGSSATFQDTGTLSLVPYLSYAKNFLRDWSYGSFNFMATTGYSASVNSQRSDYYFLSGHLDFDWMNCHHFYPLMEMNWFCTRPTGRQFLSASKGVTCLTSAVKRRGRGC